MTTQPTYRTEDGEELPDYVCEHGSTESRCFTCQYGEPVEHHTLPAH